MTPTLLTSEEYLLIPDSGKPTELVKGVIVERPFPMARHGQICATTSFLLSDYLHERPSGHVVCNNAGVITERSPDTVRGPDLSYYSFSRVPLGPMPAGWLNVLPEMVIEVRQRWDSWSDLRNRVIEFLNAGVSLVLVLDEETGTAHVNSSDRPPYPVPADGELDLSEVIPGLRLVVRRFFE